MISDNVESVWQIFIFLHCDILDVDTLKISTQIILNIGPDPDVWGNLYVNFQSSSQNM